MITRSKSPVHGVTINNLRQRQLYYTPKKQSFGGYIGVTVSVGRMPYFLTNHWVEFNKNLHEASIPRGDVHILKGLQLHDILQSYGPFTY